MICKTCGATLVGGAKKCFVCGSYVSDTEIVNIHEPEGEISFELEERTLVFNHDIVKVNWLKKMFADRAKQNMESFQDFYKENVLNFDDNFEQAIPYMAKKISDMVRFGIIVLKEYGITNVSYEELAEKSTNCCDLDAANSSYHTMAVTLYKAAAELSSFHEEKSSFENVWVGGGFGIAGAIKGAITAEVLNIGTKAVKHIVDTLDDVDDRKRFENAKAELLKYEKKNGNLANVTFLGCSAVFLMVLDILENEGIEKS